MGTIIRNLPLRNLCILFHLALNTVFVTISASNASFRHYIAVAIDFLRIVFTFQTGRFVPRAQFVTTIELGVLLDIQTPMPVIGVSVLRSNFM